MSSVKTSVLLLALALAWSPPANAISIDTCGTSIPPHEVGTVTSDLVCSSPTPAVTLGLGATLDLNGHRIQGISSEPQVSHSVVLCSDKRCTILGPGEVVGNDGISSYGDCIAGAGVKTTTKAVGVIDVHDCSNGLLVSIGRIQDVRAHGCQIGVYGGKTVRLRRVDVSDNAIGIWSHQVGGSSVVANGNTSFGVAAVGSFGAVHLNELTATSNGGAGVIGYAASLRNSTVTGNDGYGQGIDLASARPPRIHATTCVKSGMVDGPYVNGPPALLGAWHVCSGD